MQRKQYKLPTEDIAYDLESGIVGGLGFQMGDGYNNTWEIHFERAS
jgi:hypothetical protein